MNPGASPADVGEQLARRRDALFLTQEDLAQRIGINARTVSAAERGANAITKGRRAAWEEALRLRPGTISRAYLDGTPIEAADEPRPDQAPVEDPLERLARLTRELNEVQLELRERLERDRGDSRDVG